MAKLHQLSNKLTIFKDVYTSWPALDSSQSDLSNGLNDVSNSLDSAINGFSTASSDSQMSDLKACLTLAKDGVDRVKSHVDGDLDGLFSNGDEVNSYIEEIEQKIEEGKNWKTAWYEDVFNYTIGAIVKEWRIGDQKKIDEANGRIDQLNKKGEAQLTAMSNAINSVAFGVAGNMVHGGSLGNSITYADNYSFDPVQWEEEHPIVQLNIFQEVGCLVVGAVEGVLKVVENVADAALTVVGNVVSLGGLIKPVANFFENVIAFDAAGAVTKPLGALIAGSEEAYEDSAGRHVGNFVGRTAASIVAIAYGGPLLMGAIAMGGTAESSIQNGDGIGMAGLKGLAVGALTVVTCNVASSIGTWAQATKGASGLAGTVARVVDGANNLVGRIPGVRWLYGRGLAMRQGNGFIARAGNAMWNANTNLVHGVKNALWNARTRTAGGRNLFNHRVSTNTTTITKGSAKGTTVTTSTYRDGTTVEIRTTQSGVTTITTTDPTGAKVVEQQISPYSANRSGNVGVTSYDASGNKVGRQIRYGFIDPMDPGNTAGGLGHFTENINSTAAIAGSAQQEANS